MCDNRIGTEGSSPKDELETLRAEALAQNPECGDQFDAAKDAAYAIMAMGVFNA